jgi:SNF2-related domain
MTLALILATLDQISAPEESILDTRPVMTSLAFNYFPSEKYRIVRNRASRSGKVKSKVREIAKSGFPSLLETMMHYVRVFPEGLDLHDHEDELRDHHLWTPISLNTPFYYHYDIDIPTQNRSRRKVPDKAPRVMYLTSATIIIVPANLLSQWESEINKHCESQLMLRVLVIQKDNVLPDAKVLATDYDVSSLFSLIS